MSSYVGKEVGCDVARMAILEISVAFQNAKRSEHWGPLNVYLNTGARSILLLRYY